MVSEIDVKVLQAYLDSKPEGFIYGEMCKKIIELAKMISGETNGSQ
jgi:hypothetical protein